MNIESVTNAGPPARTAASEVTRQPARSAVSQSSRETLAEKPVLPTIEKTKSEPTKPEVEDAVKRLNAFVAPSQSEINFSIDEESGIRVVKILDSQSKEVIRQFPSEEAIELARALDKLQGLLIKDKA